MSESRNIFRTYVAVADLSEGTLSPEHALDIAEWIVRTRPTLRQRLQQKFWGRSEDEVRAQSMREERERNKRAADICTCGMAEQERTGHYPEHERWCDAWTDWDDTTAEEC